ncbi:3544_t:CDS:2 [Acaulospora morrowiae]|uniref:3544_t:CDS:1 n=1 Tax=Acaulospora morrowiae TaxID=94023 RepID=A0A9N9DR32_9GLOM|nr:3544_t:CDS:2 [Acaulospora morrowiae]
MSVRTRVVARMGLFHKTADRIKITEEAFPSQLKICIDPPPESTRQTRNGVTPYAHDVHQKDMRHITSHTHRYFIASETPVKKKKLKLKNSFVVSLRYEEVIPRTLGIFGREKINQSMYGAI